MKSKNWLIGFLIFEWLAYNIVLILVLGLTASNFDVTEIQAILLVAFLTALGAVSTWWIYRNQRQKG